MNDSYSKGILYISEQEDRDIERLYNSHKNSKQKKRKKLNIVITSISIKKGKLIPQYKKD